MAPGPRPARPSLLLLVLILSALAVGAAASIALAARAPATPAVNAPFHEVFLSDQLVILLLVLLFGAILVAAYFMLRGSGSGDHPKGIGLQLVLLIVAMVVVVVILRVVSSSGGGAPGGATNSDGSGNQTTGPTGWFGGPGGSAEVLGVPPWLLLAVIVAVAVIALAVVAPRLRAYLEERGARRPPDGRVRAEVRGALGVAAARLGVGYDARGVILDLYARLLESIRPLAADLDPSTPEEIRTVHLLRLGIRPSAADELTRLFEEARYSSHPLGRDAADRATRAIGEAEHDLQAPAALP